MSCGRMINPESVPAMAYHKVEGYKPRQRARCGRIDDGSAHFGTSLNWEGVTCPECLECRPTAEPPTTPTLKDSGQREAFTTGAQRDSRTGKGRFDLMPPRALLRVAKHFEAGALKYSDRNWEKGQPLSRYFDSAMRHLNSFLRGDTDEDHATAAAWNVLCLIETRERIAEGFLPKELDDLPPDYITTKGTH